MVSIKYSNNPDFIGTNEINTLIMAISIGNTNINLGVFAGDNKIIARDRIPTLQAKKLFKTWHKQRTLNSIASDKIISSIGKILTVSTRSDAERLVARWAMGIFGVKTLKAGKDFKIPMPVLVEEPKKVGVDRLLDAFAAYQYTHRSTLVIDFGTAITFNVISQKGEFLGGAIAPGINTMARALHNDCALLPLIKPRPISIAIGKNTEKALLSGIYLGTIGLTKYIIERITAEVGKKPVIIATGGGAELVKKQLPVINKVIPDLTLKGLLLAYQKISDKDK